MISVTKLLFARDYFGDRLRYTKNAHTMRNGAAEGVGPVVVWNSTKTCNLKCMHCYMQSDAKKYKDELTTEEAKKFIDDLADFRQVGQGQVLAVQEVDEAHVGRLFIDFGHKGTAADAGPDLQQALHLQDAQGFPQGLAADVEVFCQFLFRGQLAAPGKCSGQYLLPDAIDDFLWNFALSYRAIQIPQHIFSLRLAEQPAQGH